MSKSLTGKEFIEKSILIHGNKYDYHDVLYKNNHTKVRIFCNKCNKYFVQEPREHMRGHGCPICGENKRIKCLFLTKKKFIQKAIKIHGENYNYSKVIYKENRKKVEIICNKCKKSFMQTPYKHLKGQGCPNCSKSNGEKIIDNFLRNKNIFFIAQKRFQNCRDKKPLPFDFYLPDYNLCIEFQGQQHFEPYFFTTFYKNYNDGKKHFEKQKIRDQIKKEYCKNNNIELLEIRYNENIEEKLEEKIRELEQKTSHQQSSI